MADQLEHAEVEAFVNELQRKLDRLRVLYDQYFLGVSKREPLEAVKDVVRIIHLLEQQQIRNTSMRFRLRSLIQKFNVQRTLWRRTVRAIEMGTHKREVRRLRNRLVEEGVNAAELGPLRTVGDVERAMGALATAKKEQQTPAKRPPPAIRGKPAEELRQQLDPASAPSAEGDVAPQPAPAAATPASAEALPAQAPRPAPRAPAATPRAAASNVSDDELKSLYRRFVKAKRMVGEAVDSISEASLRRTIDKQLPKLQQLHPGREIEFHVVVRQGKAILKAKPKD